MPLYTIRYTYSCSWLCQCRNARHTVRTFYTILAQSKASFIVCCCCWRFWAFTHIYSYCCPRYNKWIGLGAHRKLSSYLSAIQLWMAELAFRVQVIIRCWWCATAFQWRTSTGNGFFLSVFFFLSIFFWLLMTMRTRCATPPCLAHFRNASAQWFGRSSSSRLRYVLRVILTPFYRHNSNKASTMQALWFMNGKKIIRKTQSQRTY